MKLYDFILNKEHHKYRHSVDWNLAAEYSPEENLKKTEKIIGDSSWEKLPYNAAAGAKYKMLGIDYLLE